MIAYAARRLAGAGVAAALLFGAPLAADPIRIGIIGDQTGSSNLASAYQVLSQGVAALNAVSPALNVVIHSGDLVESTASEDQIKQNFAQATGILKGLSVPWYLAAGDHDVNPPTFVQNSPDRSRETLFKQLYSALNPKVANQLYYSFDVANYHFVALYAEEHLDTDSRWGNVFYARMTDDQYNWLAADLAQNAHGKDGIVVFLHQPMWYIWSDWSRVHALLAQYPTKAVISGHTHYNQNQIALDGIQYWVVGATGGDTKQGQQNAGDLQHVTLLTIDGAQIQFQMIPLAPYTQTTWTPRVIMDRVQAIDQMLGSLFSFATNSPVFVQNNQLVSACGSATPAQLVVKDIGNAVARPATATINVTGPPGFAVTQGSFGDGLCAGSLGTFQCTLNASAGVAVSNTSLVQLNQYPPPPPLWTGTLGVQGTAPGAGGVITLQLLMSFEEENQSYAIFRTGSTTIQACSG